MIFRALATALTALAVVVPSALAQDVVPLAGKGENIAPVARVKIPRPTEVEVAGNWAFVATDQAEEAQGGLYIVNIADPAHPFIEGKWTGDDAGLSDVSFGDVDLSTDGNLAVLTNAHCSTCAEGSVAWAVLIDTTDKAHPVMSSQIVDDATMDYVHTATLDNNTLYMNPQVWAAYPQAGNEHITVFDISDRRKPVKKGTITTPLPQLGLAHDTYIDHRPDGKTLMYAASVHRSDVLDVTNPLAASWLQTATSEYTISHDLQPNHDRTILVLDDEGAAGGQVDEGLSICGKLAGTGPASVDSGSVHFFGAAPDGTFANAGLLHLGSFNAPTNFNTGACVAHVFWQAPTENRLTQAYYRTGAFVLDFEDPANAKMLGWFLADGGANYWSNKPHRGYMFATDQDGHLDILKYTGEGGNRWPATSGPAEIQRSARQGVPYVPIPGAGPLRSTGAAKNAGKFAFTAKVKRVTGKAGKKATLTLRFTNSKGKVVARVTIKRTAGKKATIKVSGVALAGTYRWTLKAGKKTLSRGKVRVTKSKNGEKISAGASMVAKAK